MSREITSSAARQLQHISRNATDVLRVLSMDFLVLPSVTNRFSIVDWVAGVRFELAIVNGNGDMGHAIVSTHGGVDHILHAVANLFNLFAHIHRVAKFIKLSVNYRHPTDRVRAVALTSLEPLVDRSCHVDSLSRSVRTTSIGRLRPLFGGQPP